MSIELKVINEENKEETSKEEYAISYLKSMLAIEQAMDPYKDQKKDLRKDYIKNGWLTKDEIWAAIKALRLYEKGTDMDDLNDMFETVERQFGRKDDF